MKSQEEATQPVNNKTIKCFEFKRIRPSNAKSDNNGLPEIVYKVPKKRSGHRAVCNEENLWIWGGYNPARTEDQNETLDTATSDMLSELYRFNFASKKWMLLKTTGNGPNDTVASHATILYKNLMICWGGTGYPFGQVLDNALYICNLKTLEWKKHKINGVAPIALYGSSMVLVDNYLYVLFGTNSRLYSSNVYRINIETLVSECLFDSIGLLENASFRMLNELENQYPDEFLTGRYRQEVVVHDKKIFVFGGGKSDGNAFPLNKLPVFDLEKNVWTFLHTTSDLNSKSYPENRKFHSCVKIDHYCYVFGGLFCDLEQDIFKTVENCVWRLNLNDLKWEKLDIPIPVVTYFHATCSNSEGVVYIHGGIKDLNNGSDVFKQERINHLYLIHLKVPKLKEICWSFLTENFANITKLSKDALVKAGITIPINYLNRIN